MQGMGAGMNPEMMRAALGMMQGQPSPYGGLNAMPGTGTEPMRAPPRPKKKAPAKSKARAKARPKGRKK